VVEPRELCSFLGSWERIAVRRHLKRLRSDGQLVCRPGRLQAKVRGAGLTYVFRGHASEVPRLGRPRRRVRVGTW
jgi:hypothetical protein